MTRTIQLRNVDTRCSWASEALEVGGPSWDHNAQMLCRRVGRIGVTAWRRLETAGTRSLV